VDVEDWWRVNEVNVKGVFLMSQAVLRRMAPRGRGRVINMASDTAIKPFPTLSAYATSKAALLRMTDSFALAAEPFGLSLFAVSPGMVKTEMTALLPNAAEIPESTWTAPEKIVNLCLYLASGRADALSGRYFHVNRDDIESCVANAKQIQEADSHALRLSLGVGRK
jgi:NAD(P)-dependent dehydrogenase (short-subunit alcohol dehydrogenase family)